MKYPRKGHQRDHHLPISPGAAHPDNGILLSLQSNAKLRKMSYIKTEYKYTLSAAFFDPYCRSGKEYKLTETSYDTLKAYIKFTPPTTHSIHHSDQLDRSFVHHSISSLDVLTAPLSCSCTTQQILSQIQSTPHTRATSRSLSTYPLQPPVSPPSHHTRVAPSTWQDPHMYNDPQRTRQALLLPYTQPSSTPSPREPELDFSEVAASLLFLASVGTVAYGRHRLWNIGKWILKEMKGKWSDPRVTLVREKGLQIIRAILQGSVSMVCSMDGTALFDSIKNRIGGIQQGLEAYSIYVYRCLRNYRPILYRLVEGTLGLRNPS